jgi:hypothetical protein
MGSNLTFIINFKQLIQQNFQRWQIRKNQRHPHKPATWLVRLSFLSKPLKR